MPRWPEKDKIECAPAPEATEQTDAPEAKSQPEQVAHYAGLLWNRIDDLSFEIGALNRNLAHFGLIDAATRLLQQAPRTLQRRRTEDEMRQALRLILSGQPRPRDDESAQILEDTINELFALRQLNMDLMQSISTAYQNGIAAIRALTSR